MHRTRNDPKLAELRTLPLFSASTNRQLERIGRLADEVRFPAGHTLMTQGTHGRECFVVLEGEAEVAVHGRTVAHAGAGDIIGEMALLDDAPRSATVTARTPLRALVLTRRTLTAMIDVSPAVARRIMGTLARRLRDVQSATQAA